MFNVGEYVICKRDLCKIKDIQDNYIMGKKYYILSPVDDESLIINIPFDNQNGLIRKVISKEMALNLIDQIPTIEVAESNDRLIESEYKALMNSNTFEDLIKIIKTSYLRNTTRIEAGKKVGDKDKEYFSKAEKYLYNEFAIALGMTYDDVKEYIIKEVNKLTNN
jgi:CarD family transcriptional regulator